MNSLENNYDDDASEEELVVTLSENNKKEVESEKKPMISKPTSKRRPFRLINWLIDLKIEHNNNFKTLNYNIKVPKLTLRRFKRNQKNLTWRGS